MKNRDTVGTFAELMRQRLESKSHLDNHYSKDGKLTEEINGWLKDDISFEDLLTHMAEHCGEINALMRVHVNGGGKEKIFVADRDIPELSKQCADCANFAMMIMDRALCRKKVFNPTIGDFAAD